VDLSALIFVALAVAWAVYLIPKALRHHEEDAISRSVDSFSDRMRVLARREAVSAAKAELVKPTRKPVTAEKPEPEAAPVATADPAPAPTPPAPLTPLQVRLRRAKAARAAARRRRVLGSILVLNLVVVALASASVIAWAWAALPAALLVGWLVACRLMVKKERAAAPAAVVRKRRRTLADEAIAEEDSAAEDLSDETSEVAAVAETPEQPTPGGWDPVPMTLPTYVAKAPAGRTVRTIDLDSTGVWSSGRNAADSQLAREAEAVAERPAESSTGERRASGA
jgi:hypothetical protein